MYFLRNSRLIKQVSIVLPVMLLLAGNFFCSRIYAAETSPSDEAIRILERWTSVHWGQDCFVWIVHYPEEFVKSWVEAEAIRTGMNDSEREAFRKKFVSDLRLDSSETFLVSVYSFGSRPVNLDPVRETISLFPASGERIKPSKYDSTLDNPSLGIVQGLVFFPKQTNKDYVIGVKGIWKNERVFSFAPPEIKQEPIKQEPEKKPEVVVVNLPKKQSPKKKEPEQITPPPPPPIPPRPIQPLFDEDSETMEEFVKSVQEHSNSKAEVKDLRQARISNPLTNSNRPSNIDSSYSSREAVLRKFLLLWADGAAIEMYEMLSDTSKRVISRDNFAKEIAKDSNLRSGIKKGDYRIDWIGEERAKIITTYKTLFVKSVATQTLGVTREGSSWKIVWY